MRISTIFFLLAFFLHCDVALAQQDMPDPRAGQVDALFKDFNQAPSPGLAVAVVRDGKVLLVRGYGLASIEHNVRITPSTVFDAASLAKQFTGLAVAMLVSDGRIKLSDDIRKHIPQFPTHGRSITVAHLLHHTGGLRDWTGVLRVGGWQPGDAISHNDILTMARNQRGLNFDPGAEHMYSNTGYNLLADLVQQVTKQSFRAWTEERIFRPLGMSNTRFREDHTEVIAARASGYKVARGGKYGNMPNNLAASGSSSLFTSVEDLARWMLNFKDARVGGPAAMSLMLTQGTLNDGTVIPYAFGVQHGRYGGLPLLTHSGSWASFRSCLMYFPQQKFGVVVLANSDAPQFDAQNAAAKIVNIFLKQEFIPMSPDSGRIVDLPPATLDYYVGRYRLGPGWYAHITRVGSTLWSEVVNESAAELAPRSEQEFWVASYGATMVFRRGDDGKVTHLEYHGKRAPKVGEAGALSPAQASEYAGHYESEELDTSYRVAVRGVSPWLLHRRYGAIRLTRLWQDDFSTEDGFVRSVEFQRDGAGRVNGLVITVDEQSRNIRFVKRR
jgi:CubicO group peptidase (beta-lactamase class C family)